MSAPAFPAGGGVKHDNGKPPLSLLPRDALEGAARVLAFGRDKYGADNWRGGFAWRRLLDAALRHVVAFADGEDLDPETHLPHIDHALCCLLFLSTHAKRGLGTDDRYRGAPAEPGIVDVEYCDAPEGAKL